MVAGGRETWGRRKRGALLARRMAEGAKPPFDIIERTFEFGLMVMELVRRLPAGVTERHLAYQLIKSGTSVGANVEEGYGAESVKDRIHKFSIATKKQTLMGEGLRPSPPAFGRRPRRSKERFLAQ